MKQRIYYHVVTGRIVLVTDGLRTVQEEIGLYRLPDPEKPDSQLHYIELLLTRNIVSNITDYYVHPETKKLTPLEPDANPDVPWEPGPTPVDLLQNEVDALELEVGAVRIIAEQAKTQAVDGKAGLSAAITAMGVPALPDESFEDLSTKIGQIFTGSKVKSGSYASLAPRGEITVELGFEPVFFLANAENSYSFQVSYHKTMPGLTYTNGAFTAILSGTKLIITNPGTVQTRMNINYIAVS